MLKYIKSEIKIDINDLIEVLVKEIKWEFTISTDSWFDYGQWSEINKNISVSKNQPYQILENNFNLI